jgi:hypothetical protein
MTPEYLAGLFDGEGCIDVQRCYPKAGRNRLYVRPRVRMCMTNSARFLADRLHAKFGGHLVSRKAGKANQQDSWSLEWLNGVDIRRFLNLILPHLVLKAEQAKLVLWWLDNASGRCTTAGYVGMEQARAAFVEELRAMKVDPQRLSERAVERIVSLMRQSGLHGDMERTAEMAVPLG